MGAAKKVRGKVKLFAFPRSKTKKYSSSSGQSSEKLINQKGRGGAIGRAVVKQEEKEKQIGTGELRVLGSKPHAATCSHSGLHG